MKAEFNECKKNLKSFELVITASCNQNHLQFFIFSYMCVSVFLPKQRITFFRNKMYDGDVNIK